MLKMITTAALVGLFAATLAPTASGQEVPTDQIIDSLMPKVLTRSALSSAPAISTKDQEFLRRIPSRGITFEQQEKFVEITKEAKLPTIDIPIQFELNSAVINAAAYKQVEALANALKDPRLASGRFALNGHTDAKGSDKHNQTLSEARAASVRKALVTEFGIPEANLVVIGFGERSLKAADDPEGAINRRVEVVRIGDV